jgi:ssDNA-binding Zn-finger/Zn-ribbon topoisomerase 1
MSNTDELFHKLRKSLLNLDPVAFCENYLTLEGEKFSLTGNGYKPFADIYRYVGLKALDKDAKPISIVKGRQVGGTTMAAALEMYFMGSGLFGVLNRPPIRVIHAFPQLEAAAAYSKTKLNPMIGSSLSLESEKKNVKVKSYMQSLLDTTTATNDSLHFKQFLGGNHLWIESTGLDANRLRGRSADVIFFDEVQDIPQEAINNATKMLAQSKYGPNNFGVQVYFGTPKKKGSTFNKIWSASSQQYYYLGCEKCSKLFPLYTPGSDEWEKIWLHTYIVKCNQCGHEQDKRAAAERGKWVSTKDPAECDYIGFHINQLYMPNLTKEDVIKQKPGVHPTNTERAWQNEILGEFFQGDASPITPEEIRDKCGDFERKLRARIIPGEEYMVVAGIDYGARADLEQLADPEKGKGRGQSYSTAVVLALKGPNLLSVEFATKFVRNDIDSKKSIIDQMMRQYSVKLAIGDIGFSQDFSTIMHTAYGDRYLVSRAHNKVNGNVKFNSDAFPKEIIFERDHYIGELFEMMKAGNIRFPLGSFEKIGWLINHCASMEIKPTISKYGDPTMHYVKGSTPNDGFMALLNAYIAYKFLITSGFNNNNPSFNFNKNNRAQIEKPLALTGYISRKM